MRIGELLVQQGKLRHSDLTRALANRPESTRLCSYLIAQGLIDLDDGSRALGELHGVPCALAKHLEGRDPTLASVIPAELGRSSCALPIGKTSKGAVIVCVRDPAPALLAALEQATRASITMVIAPADKLQKLVNDAYGDPDAGEFDIDFDTGVGNNPAPSPAPRPAQPAPPPMPDMSALDPESVRLALTDLDDVRVAKDPSQSGQIPIPAISRTATPSGLTAPTMTVTNVIKRPVDARVGKPMSMASLKAELEAATTREAATDLALAFIATRWHSGIVLAVRDKTAIGYRGHGVTAPETVTIPLAAPSTVQRAFESRVVSVHAPMGPAQDALAHALRGPANPAAAPVLVSGQPVAVIAVGDPIGGVSDLERASADLAVLADSLGAAYQRMIAR
jgi:hypothetical protein